MVDDVADGQPADNHGLGRHPLAIWEQDLL